MRLGIGVDVSVASMDELAGFARRCDDAGIDLLWLEGPVGRDAAVIQAAAGLSGITTDLVIAGRLHVDRRHPLYLAEDIAVVDNLLGGRWIPCLTPSPGDETTFDEATRVLVTAGQSRPFAHAGPTWVIPARLPENSRARATTVLVAPSRVEAGRVWVDAVAGEPHRAHGYLDIGTAATVREYLGATEASVVGRCPWAVVRDLDDEWPSDPARLVDDLREMSVDGADTVVLRSRRHGMDTIPVEKLAGRIRTAAQLPDLPTGLEEFWDTDERK